MQKTRLIPVSGVLVFLLMLNVMQIPIVRSQDPDVNENYFNLRVTILKENGDFVELNDDFDTELNGNYLDIGLHIDLIQVRGAFIDFAYLKINGKNVLHAQGTFRVDSLNYSGQLSIEAYGEAFVPYTDSFHSDTVQGQIRFNHGLFSRPFLILLTAGATSLTVALAGIFIHRRYLTQD